MAHLCWYPHLHCLSISRGSLHFLYRVYRYKWTTLKHSQQFIAEKPTDGIWHNRLGCLCQTGPRPCISALQHCAVVISIAKAHAVSRNRQLAQILSGFETGQTPRSTSTSRYLAWSHSACPTTLGMACRRQFSFFWWAQAGCFTFLILVVMLVVAWSGAQIVKKDATFYSLFWVFHENQLRKNGLYQTSELWKKEVHYHAKI